MKNKANYGRIFFSEKFKKIKYVCLEMRCWQALGLTSIKLVASKYLQILLSTCQCELRVSV